MISCGSPRFLSYRKFLWVSRKESEWQMLTGRVDILHKESVKKMGEMYDVHKKDRRIFKKERRILYVYLKNLLL